MCWQALLIEADSEYVLREFSTVLRVLCRALGGMVWREAAEWGEAGRSRGTASCDWDWRFQSGITQAVVGAHACMHWPGSEGAN